jgi:two-component system response regulator AtoC
VTELSLLLVDDEENIRFSLARLLERHGYRVTTAVDGEDALQRLQRHEFDIVLSDLRMPKRDGLELLAELRQRRVLANVVLMSAYASRDDALAAVRAGAADYVAKPVNPEELLFTLRKVHERSALQRENEALRRAARGADGFHGILARSAPMRRVFDTVRKIAEYRTTVLLSGESGTGKEMVARALHTSSSRRDAPWVAVNCGAIPEPLLESELFGHVRGAFTDATRDKVGLFEEANGGTLFLDEIGDLPLLLQVKLLRVLQESEIRRVGDNRVRTIDVRIVAASVHDLGQRVREGRFREDLYYRLNVLPLHLPPLRERPEDIPLLADHFVQRLRALLDRDVRGISPQAMATLTEYGWPGNVRELENVIERAMVLSEGSLLGVDDLPDHIRATATSVRSLIDTDELSIKRANRVLEATLIQRALERTGGNRTAASRLLEISHRALLYKLKDYFPDGVPGES